MTNAERQTLATIVDVLSHAGIVRKADVADAETLVDGLNADSIIAWVQSYGYDADAAERVRSACATGRNTRVLADMGRAYTAAVVVVLTIARRGYNRGELAELAAAILIGRFPEYGFANSRSAKDDTADIMVDGYGISVKNGAARCTFVDGDMADALMMTLGNADVLYILNRQTWAELEDGYAEVDDSRGSKRSPRSKKSIAAMVEWLEGRTA